MPRGVRNTPATGAAAMSVEDQQRQIQIAGTAVVLRAQIDGVIASRPEGDALRDFLQWTRDHSTNPIDTFARYRFTP